ncbi:hypothetical protein ACFLVJ_03025 [Chloroflexota bacterium]
MKAKIFLGVLMAFSLLFASCYPELSIQQYDQLKDDLDALDIERQELRVKVAELETKLTALETELASIREKTPVTLSYINFLNKMVSTQSSAKILEGEFDVEALVGARDGLITDAKNLVGEDEITYLLNLMDSENESRTVSVYYKIIEICIKNMKQNLE